MLWTILTIAVCVMLGAGVLAGLWSLVWGLITLPDQFRERRLRADMATAAAEHRRTNPLARMTPDAARRNPQGIPWDIRRQAESFPVISPSASASDIEHKLWHWYVIRDHYGYLPKKARIRMTPPVHRVAPYRVTRPGSP